MANDCLMLLNKFLGLHLTDDGGAKLTDGESPYLKNFKIVPGYQLRRREGYRVLQSKTGGVRALWQGTLLHERLYLALIGETLYASADAFATLRVAGEIAGSAPVRIFEFCEKLYFFTGSEIKCFDGQTLSDLSPYRPLVRIGTLPAGGGTVFEDANLLTGQMRQSFSPDGDSTLFVLALKDVESVDYVTQNGTDLAADSYIVDLEAGTVCFHDAPLGGVPDSLEIGFTKTAEGAAEKITHCRFAVAYCGSNDTRAFLWGNPSYPAMRFYSGVAEGLPSMDYFPESHFSLVGDGEKITDIIKHYDRQIIFTPHATYYSYPEDAVDADGKSYLSFPVYTLSAVKGSVAEGSASLLDNKPFSVMPDGLYLWNSTSIRDERNAVCFSARIAKVFSKYAPQNALYYNRVSQKELFCVFADGIYVYNYLLDVFYYYEGVSPCAFWEDDRNTLFFGTADGKLCVVGGDADGEKTIEAVWQSSHLNLGNPAYTKNLFSVTVGVAPSLANYATLEWTSDKAAHRTGENRGAAISFGESLFSFRELRFDAFTFDTAHSTRLFTRRIKIKRLSFFKLIIKHARKNTGLHIFSLLFRGKINDQRV